MISKNTMYIFHKYIPSTTIQDYLSESQLITKDKLKITKDKSKYSDDV